MFYREIFSLCSHIHTKHLNTLNGQNVVILKDYLSVHIVSTGLQMVKSLLYTPVTLSCIWKYIRFVFKYAQKSNLNGQNVVILNDNLSVHIVSTGLQMVKSLLYKPVS